MLENLEHINVKKVDRGKYMNNDSISYTNSVFEQPWWLNMVAPGLWNEAIVEENGEIIGRMPYVYKNKRVVMPPLTQTLGPWISKRYRKFQVGNKQLSKQKEIINNLMLQLPQYREFNMTFDSSNGYILPYRWLGFKYNPTFSYRINDLTDLEKLYSNFNKTVKKNIKSAQNKTEIILDDSPEKILVLLDKTFEMQGRKAPGDKELKRRIIQESLKRNNGKIFIAEDSKGNVHSGAFVLYDEKVSYYLLGGSDFNFRSSGAQSLVLWKAITFAADVSEMFDFEGSNVEGIENFFRQFGGEQVINYNLRKQSLFSDCLEEIKPRLKKLFGYKI